MTVVETSWFCAPTRSGIPEEDFKMKKAASKKLRKPTAGSRILASMREAVA
jgi:hypothetical protein